MKYYITNDELYHHGILGQKWGVRRFQNKDGSLTSAGRSRQRSLRAYRNEKAGKKGKDRTGTAALSTYDNATRMLGSSYRWDRATTPNTSYQTHGYYIGGNKNRQDNLKDLHSAIEARKLKTEFEKENGTVGNLSGRGSYQYTYNRNFTNGKYTGVDVSTATLYKKFQGQKLDESAFKMTYDELRDSDKPTAFDKLVKDTNPGYGKQEGYNTNCVGCSTVNTLKKMGYTGITAAPIMDGVNSKVGTTAWFNGAHKTFPTSMSDLEKQLLEQPVGAYGELTGSRFAYDFDSGKSVKTSGHSMSYSIIEVEDRYGDKSKRVLVEDGQTGRVYNDYNSLDSACRNQQFADREDSFSFTRLDNTTPNWKALAADGVLSEGYSPDKRIVLTDNGNTKKTWADMSRDRGTHYEFLDKENYK